MKFEFSPVTFASAPSLMVERFEGDYLVLLLSPDIEVHAKKFAAQLCKGTAVLFLPHFSEQHSLLYYHQKIDLLLKMWNSRMKSMVNMN